MPDLKDAQQIAREFMSRQSLTLDVAPELATWIKPLAELIRRERVTVARSAAEKVRALKTGNHWQNDQAREEAAAMLESFAQSLEKEKP